MLVATIASLHRRIMPCSWQQLFRLERPLSSDFRLAFVAEIAPCVPVNQMAYFEPEDNTTIRNCLDAILGDRRTHREIASDPAEGSMRNHVPTPFRLAATAMSRKEGCLLESLLAPLLSSVHSLSTV